MLETSPAQAIVYVAEDEEALVSVLLFQPMQIRQDASRTLTGFVP